MDVPYLMSLEPKMADITKGCSVSYSSNRYMEFNKEGVDKGVGLQHLADQLGIKIEETIAVGKACDYTTHADNNEGVVAELIKKFIFHEDI